MTSRVPVACEAHKDDLAALALGEPLGGREAALRQHLETCSGCRAYHAAMARTLGALRALPQPEPPAALTERILAAARQSQRPTLLPSTGFVARWLEQLAAAFRRPLLASAIVAVVVAATAVALLVLGRDGSPTPAAGPSGPQLARFEAPAAAAPAQPVALRPPAATSEKPADELRAAESELRNVESERWRGPYPPVPEAVQPAAPVERQAGDIQVEQAPADGAELERLTARLDESNQQRAGGQAVTRSAGTPATAPAPAQPVGPAEAQDSGGRFSPSREITAGEGEVVVVGTLPPAEPDVADGRTRDESQAAAGARAAETGTTSSGPVTVVTLATDAEPMGNAVAQGGGGSPAVTTPAPPPPAVPVVSTTAQTPAPQAYPGAAAAPTESLGLYAAPPADQSAGGWGGFTGADDAAAEDLPARDNTVGTDRVSVARRQLADGDAASAEEVLEQAMREETARAADVTFLLAETYARQGKWSDAARTYELFLARYLDDPRANEARWRGADAYRRAGNQTRSAALLQQLVGASGYDDRARTALSELSIMQAEAAAGQQPAEAASSAEAVSAPATVEPASPPSP